MGLMNISHQKYLKYAEIYCQYTKKLENGNLHRFSKRDKLYNEGELFHQRKHTNLLKQSEARRDDTELQRNEVVIE